MTTTPTTPDLPEPLRLAALMDAMDYADTRAAAAELRRLHAENQRLSELCDRWNSECDEFREDNKRLADLSAAAPAAPIATSAAGGDWTQPTTVAQRLGDVLQLLCGGARPPEDMVQEWLDGTSEELQDFCATHGPAWAQGIGLIDAAMVAVDHPTEIAMPDSEDHEHRGSEQPGAAIVHEGPEVSAAWNKVREEARALCSDRGLGDLLAAVEAYAVARAGAQAVPSDAPAKALCEALEAIQQGDANGRTYRAALGWVVAYLAPDMRGAMAAKRYGDCLAEAKRRLSAPAAVSAPSGFVLIDPDDFRDIIRDIGQHIDQGVASERKAAAERSGYGTGLCVHIANQMAKMSRLIAAAPQASAEEGGAA